MDAELAGVRIDTIELRRVHLALVEPFVTAHGTSREREMLLVRVRTDEGDGWGECAAPAEPTYTGEYVEGAHHVVVGHLAPRLLAVPGPVGPGDVARVLAGIRGHRMAKAALEMAVMDAALRAAGLSLAAFLGATRAAVPAGVAVGVTGDVRQLVEAVGRRVAQGYRRVKLKIAPGWDAVPVAAVREAFGLGLLLQVDANGSYALGDPAALQMLDGFGLTLIEQPLAPDDLLGHARLAETLATPLCLDESITSAAVAATALALGACRVVNVKPGRVGGLLEAVRVHDACVAAGVDAWVGGMLETGLGRAANVALAALPGFTLPGDLSASDRWFETDLTEPLRLGPDGCMAVPTGAGVGPVPLDEVLGCATASIEELGRRG